MKRANTKKHWTALAVARYYDTHGTAARLRDLWPYAEELFEKPINLGSTLGNLNQDDIIDHIVVQVDGEKAYAYYPTPITIEDLRDLGEPTELPDGTMPEKDWDTTIPSARVAAEDTAEPPTQIVEAPEYETARPDSSSGGPTREYDNSGIAAEPDAVVGPKEADDDGDAEDAAYECACGRTFDNGHAYGGHKAHCPEVQTSEPDSDNYLDWAAPGETFDPASREKPADDGLTQEEWLEVGQRIDDLADKAARNRLPIIHSALRHLAERADEGEIDEQVAQMFLRGTTLDPFAESTDCAA